MTRPLCARVTPGGFVLVEAAAAVLVCCLVISVLLVSATRSRRLARLGEDFAHLRQIGQLTGAYGKDNADQYWTFSWKAGVAPINPSEPAAAGRSHAPTDLQAAANQFVYLLRTRGNRPRCRHSTGSLPHSRTAICACADYAGTSFPWRAAVSSKTAIAFSGPPTLSDTTRVRTTPTLASARPQHQLAPPYSASLRIPTAFFRQLACRLPHCVRLEPLEPTSCAGTAMLGPTLMTSVAHPSLKVHVERLHRAPFRPAPALVHIQLRPTCLS
jgi:hypothetical protein